MRESHGADRRARHSPARIAHSVVRVADDSLIPVALIVVGLIGLIATGANALQVRAEERAARQQAAFLTEAGPVARSFVLSGFARATAGRPQVSAGETGGRRVDRYDTWADDVPARMVDASVREVEFGGDHTSAVVSTQLTLRGPDPVVKRLALLTAIEVRLVQVDARDGEPEWAVSNVRVDTSGLGALRDPIVLESGKVMVIADSEHRTLAREALSIGVYDRPRLERNYRSIATRSEEVLFIVADDVTTGADVLHDDEVVTFPPQIAGFTTQTGTIVLDGGGLSQLPEYARAGTIRHELTHRVTTPLFDAAPPMIVEGLAMHAESRPLSGEGTIIYDMRPAQQRFRSRDFRYQELLQGTGLGVAKPSADDEAMAYLMGHATLSYIEARYGHEHMLDFLAALDGPGTVDAALESSLGINPRQLENGVRDWVEWHVAAQRAAGIEFSESLH